MLTLPLFLCLLSTATGSPSPQNISTGSVVRVEHSSSSFQISRNGKPYFVKGAGGSADPAYLASVGGNSVRTWGADGVGKILDEAQKQGLTVTVGMWLQHQDQFNYSDPVAVQKQFDACKAVVEKYKNHPAVLAWAYGNEMESGGDPTNPNLWKAVEQLAAMSHSVDPNHPAMTVIAEIGGGKVQSIDKWCPDIDIIGVNSYGGAASLPKRYSEAGATKPYILTEFGPNGPWEVGKTAWGAPYEPSSTEKAKIYRAAYEANPVQNKSLCLGSYVFLWGSKTEGTPTWFGMYLPTGQKTESIAALSSLWTGKPMPTDCPSIESLRLSSSDTIHPGDELTVRLESSGSSSSGERVRFVVLSEVAKYNDGGSGDPEPHGIDNIVTNASAKGATIFAPGAGTFRVYAYVLSSSGWAAVANVPFRVVAN